MLKWGICTCGSIAEDFVTAINEYSKNHKLVAVAARSEERAKNFAKRFNIPKYYDSYEKLAKSEDLEVVYIGSINSEHINLVKLFLNNGKHVLVEKPMGLNVKECEEMISLAQEKNLFFMEGIWSRFFPVYKMIEKSIKDGDLGEILHINVNFQVKPTGDVERVKEKRLGGSAMLDIGIYAIQFALFAMSDHQVTKAQSQLKVWPNQVDLAGQMLLEFDNNATAFLSYHFDAPGDTSAAIYGEKGSIIIPTFFWCPEEVIINGKHDAVTYKPHRGDSKNSKYNYDHSWGFIYQANHVGECIKKGMIESDVVPLNESLRIAQLMEQLLSQ